MWEMKDFAKLALVCTYPSLPPAGERPQSLTGARLGTAAQGRQRLFVPDCPELESRLPPPRTEEVWKLASPPHVPWQLVSFWSYTIAGEN